MTGSLLSSTFFVFFFFFPSSFIRTKPQPNCRNKMARKPNCISVAGYQTFERSKTCTHIGDSHAGELIYLSIQVSICLTGIKVFGLFLIFFRIECSNGACDIRSCFLFPQTIKIQLFCNNIIIRAIL